MSVEEIFSHLNEDRVIIFAVQLLISLHPAFKGLGTTNGIFTPGTGPGHYFLLNTWLKKTQNIWKSG